MSIEGKWIDKEDPLSIMVFTDTKCIEIYNNKTLSSSGYHKSTHSCDSAYYPEKAAKKLDFISLEDGRCFEITGLSNTALAYRYTKNGKLHVFYRSKQ
jgi:hypothetical protein